MSGSLSDRDHERIARLLGSLREPPRGSDLDVTARVLRQIGALPVPRSWYPLVTLRQFGWAAAAAMLLLSLGTVGLTGSLGAGARVTPVSILEAAHRTGGGLWAAASGFARVVVRAFSGTAARYPIVTSMFEGTFVRAAWGAALVCAVVLVLTILVVSHETRVRRVRG